MKKTFILNWIKRLDMKILALALLGFPSIALAAEGQIISAGDTTFIMLSAAMVMLMTPGLGLFYGGMVRTKNVLGTILQAFAVLAIISVQWVLWGYSLSFGTDIGSCIGGLNYLGLATVGQAPSGVAPTIPHLAFMVFQAMFAIITPALIAGAVAERIKFSTFLVFVVLWATFVYDPIAHWVWGGGWLGKLGTALICPNVSGFALERVDPRLLDNRLYVVRIDFYVCSEVNL